MLSDVTGTIALANLNWKQRVKVRDTVLFIMLLSLGYQLLLRTMNVLFDMAGLIPYGEVAVYAGRLIFFVPCAIIFALLSIFKKPKKLRLDDQEQNQLKNEKKQM